MRWLDSPLSGWWCAVGWLAATAVFVGAVQLLGGPTSGDAGYSSGSTWAIAHGQWTCAFPSSATSIAPLYPIISGGVAAALRIGHSVPFPSGAALAPHCSRASNAFVSWSTRAHALPDTIRIGYLGWVALLGGVVAFLRASGRGRRGWEPATLMALACLPLVWLPVQNFFHPQDLLAVGLALAAMACARRDAWVGAGVLLGLALLSQQLAVLVAVPLLVVAPVHRRVSFALAALAAALVVTVPLLITNASRAARDVLLGTGDNPYDDGTFVALLHLRGAPLVFATRLAPLALSLLLSTLVVRRVGRAAAMEADLLVSLVALSLSMRLVFEASLYGYYFMPFAVALVLLDVVRGRVRAAVVVWLAVTSLAYIVGPTTAQSVFWRVSWGHWVQQVLPPTVLVLAGLLIAVSIAGRGLHRGLLAWVALALGAILVGRSPLDPLGAHFVTASWQLALLASGIALAAAPLARRMVGARDPDPVQLDEDVTVAQLD